MKINIKKLSYIFFSVITLISLIKGIILLNYTDIIMSLIALLVLPLPYLIGKLFKLDIPTFLEVFLHIFIYAGIVLGSVFKFYDKIFLWDNMLHLVWGFVACVFAYSLIYILNKNHNMSIPFILLFCFSFSLMCGVIWEFIEFTCDNTIRGDMQKDFIIDRVVSTKFGDKIDLKNIEYTIIHTKDNDYIIRGGYLDIGLTDTIKDLFANFIGAIIYVVFMYIYLRNNKCRFMHNLIIKRLT